MYIVKPKVELWKPITNSQHISRCGSVCYGSKGNRTPNTEKDIKFVETLIKNNHLSVLRHGSIYFVIPYTEYKNNDDLYADILTINNYNAYRTIKFDTNKDCYISINSQFAHENQWIVEKFNKYIVEEKDLSNYPLGLDIKRFTFCITTQISTSREFNRVSPNNISEESTRFCNYTVGKFDNDVTICQPHWMNVFGEFQREYKPNEPIEMIKYNGKNISAYIDNTLIIKLFCDYNIDILEEGKTQQNAKTFLGYVHKETVYYKNLLKYQFEPQDARELLGLLTATTVVYTYSIEEWIKILLLRYYGVTGKPHPNAKLVAGLIKLLLENEGYFINKLAQQMCKKLYNKDLT